MNLTTRISNIPRSTPKTMFLKPKVGLKISTALPTWSNRKNLKKRRGRQKHWLEFILETAQNLPRLRQKVYFGSVCFTVESVDKKRIKRVKVTLP